MPLCARRKSLAARANYSSLFAQRARQNSARAPLSYDTFGMQLADQPCFLQDYALGAFPHYSPVILQTSASCNIFCENLLISSFGKFMCPAGVTERDKMPQSQGDDEEAVNVGNADFSSNWNFSIHSTVVICNANIWFIYAPRIQMGSALREWLNYCKWQM